MDYLPRSRLLRLRLAFAAAAAAFVVAPLSAQPVVLYAQDFGRLDGASGRQNPADWGWSGLSGDGSSVFTMVSTAGDPPNHGIGADVGRPIDFAKVASAGTTDGTQGRGLLFFASTALLNHLVYTADVTFDPAGQEAASVSWFGGNSAAGGTQRLAVQVDGAWFATVDQVFASVPNVGAGSGFAAGAASHSVDLLGASWQTITTAGALALGSPVAGLPAGPITALGVFATESTGAITHRIDSFQVVVTPIPEPSTVAVLFVGGALGLLVLRIRRRAA